MRTQTLPAVNIVTDIVCILLGILPSDLCGGACGTCMDAEHVPLTDQQLIAGLNGTCGGGCNMPCEAEDDQAGCSSSCPWCLDYACTVYGSCGQPCYHDEDCISLHCTECGAEGYCIHRWMK